MGNLEIVKFIMEENKNITNNLFLSINSEKKINESTLNDIELNRLKIISQAIVNINKDIAFSNYRGALKILLILKKKLDIT